MAKIPSTTTTRKPRTAPTGPRKVSALLRISDPASGKLLTDNDLTIDLVLVSSDKAKLFDAIQADRSLIAREYIYPSETAAADAGPKLVQAAE